MPKRYKKRYKTKSKFTKYLNTGTKALVVAQTGLSLARRLKGLINVEFKHLPVTSSTNITTTASVHSLSSVTQGSTDHGRDGDQIKIKSLRIKAQIVHNTSGGAAQCVRMVILRDRQNNNPGTTDPLYDGSASIYGIFQNNTIQSLPIVENKPRYQILSDRVYQLQNDQKERATYEFYHHFGTGLKVRYESNATAVARVNNLYLVMLSVDAANGTTVSYESIIRYVDN